MTNGRTGDTVCEPSEVLVDGHCLTRQHIGSACEHSSQCLGGSTCDRDSCRCPAHTAEREQRCVATRKECDVSQVPFVGECLPMVSLGRACVETVQCRGAGECVDGVCDCPQGTVRKQDRCERTAVALTSAPFLAAARPTIDGSTDQIETNTTRPAYPQTCSMSGTPFLLAGKPMLCTSGRKCPEGFTCAYSREEQNYFCCSSRSQKKDNDLVNVCISGEPLVYPSTGQVIQCSRTRRCPAGFSCKRNPATHLFYCCTVPKPLAMEQYISQVRGLAKAKEQLHMQVTFFSPSKKAVKRRSCPNSFVLLEADVERKLVRRCQSRCPSTMTAVDGVCKPKLGRSFSRQMLNRQQ